ncbi:glycosyltransferase [Paraburkholderia mimosarum]|uniref:glycosyltransferase n=1 Tax=Paraburkholderia mimosarum TaxID=312026 RepID=UPI0012B675EA|nr:glycosyltransferase [Paraburkholderia mimosarum]
MLWSHLRLQSPHVAALGLTERVVIFRAVPNRDMPRFYALAEFIVRAGAFDLWGLCVSEAMAAGRPAIVSRTRGCANEFVMTESTGSSFDLATSSNCRRN